MRIGQAAPGPGKQLPRSKDMNRPAQSHPDALALQQFLLLDGVARRLAGKYPPDWLERNGRPLYLLTLAASFLAAALIGLAWGPWWTFLVPLSMPGLVLAILPRLLFGRVAGRPRWAHPAAMLDRQDVELVRRALGPVRARRALSGACFFEIWRRAHGLATDPAADRAADRPG